MIPWAVRQPIGHVHSMAHLVGNAMARSPPLAQLLGQLMGLTMGHIDPMAHTMGRGTGYGTCTSHGSARGRTHETDHGPRRSPWNV